MKNALLPALRLMIAMTILCGWAYPVVVTGIAQLLFTTKANGSLVVGTSGAVAGSELLAQGFKGPRYFHPRPSAVDYNGLGSGASNLSPASLKLREQIKAAGPKSPDLVFASGSGLDPHVSPAGMAAQVKSVAVARGIDEAKIAALVRAETSPRQFGFLGEARVNVLRVNLALDRM